MPSNTQFNCKYEIREHEQNGECVYVPFNLKETSISQLVVLPTLFVLISIAFGLINFTFGSKKSSIKLCMLYGAMEGRLTFVPDLMYLFVWGPLIA
jgi:hypothetical protein